jgi:DNA-binding transcriptional regulator YiaG
MTEQHFYRSGEDVSDPLPYTGCGLDGIFLLNGYEFWENDGDTYTNIKDISGLHAAIGRYLVLHRKGLTPKELRFLRKTMGLTQAEMATRLGNNSQSVARWEKGECEIPGSSEKLLRAIFLAANLRKGDASVLKKLLNSALTDLDERDELHPAPVKFERKVDEWEEADRAA